MSLNVAADVIFIFSAIAGLLMLGTALGELTIIRRLMEARRPVRSDEWFRWETKLDPRNRHES